MGYYVRAFCKSDAVPTVNTVLGALREQGLHVTAEAIDAATLDSPEWTEFELIYKPGNQPIPVECSRNSGDDSLASEEVSEFLDYFAKNCGGMVYADLEGFYDGGGLLLPAR